MPLWTALAESGMTLSKGLGCTMKALRLAMEARQRRDELSSTFYEWAEAQHDRPAKTIRANFQHLIYIT
eukprot:15476-Alexandrium_andersonii.AAC.1